MNTVEILLDTPTVERARRVAQSQGLTVEELLTQLIEQLVRGDAMPDPVIGSFADDTELIDLVVTDAMRTREAQALRQAGE
jgi:antitoxin component of RelBE/YafQ-DinJ toxin-antitoxin module